jgi:hypothetical protein
MVKAHLLPIAFIAAFTLAAFAGVALGQVKQYHIEHEWAKVWINQNGTIDLFYDIGFTADSGSFSGVEIGQPKRDFTIGTAMDQYGHVLETSDVSSSTDFKVRVTLNSSLPAGQTIRFNLTTNVAHMIYEDTTNPGNVGMEFVPTWWVSTASVRALRVDDLRVSIVMPSGVNVSMVKTLKSAFWNSTSLEPDGRLAVYWNKTNLSPDEQFRVGVSFPKEFVQSYETQPTGLVVFLQQFGPVLFIFGASIAVIGAVVYVIRKKPYLIPSISMETLGIRHGLTAVEASYLLDEKPTKIVTENLYSLLQKRAIWVESTKPALKLKIMQPFQDKTGTTETPLRYYEIDFLKAVKEDGTLDEEKLAHMVMFLRDTLEEKLRGYCRRDTIDYYRKIVAKAWEQVEQAGTPELASKAYNEQLLWLFLDPNYQSRTQAAFRDRAFEPSPFWLWYWYGYQHYHPNPTYKPNVETPTQAAKPPTIPGADFANNIATAVEKTSNNIVTNLEKFANAIVPTPPAAAKASSEPAHHASSCVCACAACACACACVSCACACAGGGAG